MAEEIKGEIKENAHKARTNDEKASPSLGLDAAPKKKKGKKRNVPEAHVNIHASYNNTIISVTEPNGNVICWASSGGCGFKGTRKATPYASSVAAETAMTKAKVFGVERVRIYVKGTGTGRDQALRAINASGVSIESISDRTAVPHNGCRSRKARRV
jgi:small subunit ribosomal protein S11